MVSAFDLQKVEKFGGEYVILQKMEKWFAK